MPKSDARSQAILQKIADHNIASKPQGLNPHKKKGKGKGKGKGQRNQIPDTPDITELSLHPGFFQDDKGNSLPILNELSAKSFGVVLISPDQLRPWLLDCRCQMNSLPFLVVSWCLAQFPVSCRHLPCH